MGHYVRIEYMNGEKEEVYVDDYAVRDGCLMLYIRFGVNAGERYIPLERIKEWKVEK